MSLALHSRRTLMQKKTSSSECSDLFKLETDLLSNLTSWEEEKKVYRRRLLSIGEYPLCNLPASHLFLPTFILILCCSYYTVSIARIWKNIQERYLFSTQKRLQELEDGIRYRICHVTGNGKRVKHMNEIMDKYQKRKRKKPQQTRMGLYTIQTKESVNLAFERTNERKGDLSIRTVKRGAGIAGKKLLIQGQCSSNECIWSIVGKGNVEKRWGEMWRSERPKESRNENQDYYSCVGLVCASNGKVNQLSHLTFCLPLVCKWNEGLTSESYHCLHKQKRYARTLRVPSSPTSYHSMPCPYIERKRLVTEKKNVYQLRTVMSWRTSGESKSYMLLSALQDYKVPPAHY